jgi:hypothetical protein
VDFEFHAPPGERPTPICAVARELFTGELVRTWLADGGPSTAPYDTGPDALFIAYYASAELGCHLALDWPIPARILDLYAEFRNLTSGLPVPCGHGLLGALAYHGLDALDAGEKDAMRQLAVRGGPFTAAERTALLDYCQRDIDAVAKLLPAMLPRIDLPRALFRGRYMAAAACMEWAGVPLDVEALDRLRAGWVRIKGRLIATVNRDYDVFVPAGVPILDPQSRFGAAVLQEAQEWNLDPYDVAAAACYLWQEERDSTKDIRDARRAARQATGLTHRRMLEWTEAGGDSSTWPRLDVVARSLAGEYPALGIGQGYTSESGDDDTDHAARLWETLSEHDEQHALDMTPPSSAKPPSWASGSAPRTIGR